MSTLNAKEFCDTIHRFGETLERNRMERERKHREEQTKEQQRQNDFLKSRQEFQNRLDTCRNETITPVRRFTCNAEDAEFEEV